MLAVPLVSAGRVFGTLNFHALEQDAYSPATQSLAEKIGLQISGAIANAQLFEERLLAEEALKQRTLELQQLNETLEERVLRRTADLRRSEERLRRLHSDLISAQEAERKRIAQDLHDSIVATMGAIKFSLEGKLSEMGKGGSPRITLEKIIENIAHCIEDTRRIMMNLRPSMLDDLGLLPTIEWHCREFQKTYAQIKIHREIGLQEEEIPSSLKLLIYRVMQESLNNIAKHSGATLVYLTLGSEKDRIKLAIRDNGHGFDTQKVRKGMGIGTMSERVEFLGGEFSIESTPGEGTIVRASWPAESDQ